MNPPFSPLVRDTCKTVRQVFEYDWIEGVFKKTGQFKNCKTCKETLPADTRFFEKENSTFMLRPYCRKCDGKRKRGDL